MHLLIYSHVRVVGGHLPGREDRSHLQRVMKRSSARRSSAAAAPGSGALRIAEMTATPAAPAFSTSPTLDRSIPPMAMTGALTAAMTPDSPARPRGGSPGCEAVG